MQTYLKRLSIALLPELLCFMVAVVPVFAQGGYSIAPTTGQTTTTASSCSPLSTSVTCSIGVATPLTLSPMNTDILDLSATWSGTSPFWGIKQNVTNSSTGTSFFLDLQNASTSVMNVDPNGITTASQFVSGSPLALSPSPTYGTFSGTCTATAVETVVFTNGGGVGGLGSVSFVSGVPAGTLSITAPGYGYSSFPTSGSVNGTGCTGTLPITSGSGKLVGYVLDALQGAPPGSPPGGDLRLYPDSSSLLFTGVDPAGNISSMIAWGTNGAPLIGQGSSANPIFTALNLGLSGSLTGTLPNANLPAQVQWTSVNQTTSTASISPQNGYINDDSSSLVTYTLPSSCNLGDRFRVIGKSADGWKIAQGTSQIIHFGSVNSTVGTLGYMSSTQRFDSVELVDVVACTDWVVISAIGNITVN